MSAEEETPTTVQADQPVAEAAAAATSSKEEPGYAIAQYPNNNGIKPTDFSAKACCCCCCLSFVWQVVLVASFGSFLFGFNLSLLNTAIGSISVNYGWCQPAGFPPAETTDCTANQNYVAFISTAVFIGAAIGSLTGGRFLSMGRRTMFLLADCVFLFGIVSSCVANSFPALLWARLVVGYAVGLISVVVPTYMAEMTPKEQRGKFGVMHQLMITVGIFIAVLIGLPLEMPDGEPEWEQRMFDKVWWRFMLGLAIVPVIINGFVYYRVFDFETPQFYFEKRQYDDCANLLKIVNSKEDVSTEFQLIKDGVEDAERGKEQRLGCCKALCMADYSLVIMVGILLSSFQQLSGINVFMAQSNALFSDAGFEGWEVTGFSVAITGINVLMTFPAVPLIEALGRKTLLLIGTMGQFIGVVPAAICYFIDENATYTQWLAIAGAIIFIIFFAVAYGPVLWVYLFEIYPAEIRGSAAGAATAFNWIFGIVMVFVTNYIDNKISYTLFAVMSLAGFIIVLTMVRESKGRSIEDSPYVKNKKEREV